MVRISMNEITTYSWTFEQDVLAYADAGYDAIGIWREKIFDYGHQRAIELLAESGLVVSNLQWAGGFTGSDGRGYKDSVLDAMELIRLAAELRAEVVVLYSGSRAGHTFNHARRILRNALRRLVPLAEEYGVVLAIEPVHERCPGEWSFLHTLEQTLDFLEPYRSEYLQIAFDTYHLGVEPLDLELVRQAATRVAVVHLADGHTPGGEQDRCLLGEGQVPIGSIIQALTEGGYDGYYDIELMGEAVEGRDYGDILHQARLSLTQMAS